MVTLNQRKDVTSIIHWECLNRDGENFHSIEKDMDAIGKPFLVLPSPIAYLRAPSQKPGFASLSQTCGRLQASLLLCHKGMLVAQLEKESLSSCFRGVWDGGLCARRKKMRWHSGRKKGVPRCEMTASAQVSQDSNPDRSGSTASSESLLSAQEFFDSFLRSRQLRNDFVSKASDVLWKRELWDVDEEKLNQVRARLAELQKLREEDDGVGYLKLSQAKQWGLGMDGAPSNGKPETSDMEILEDDRRRMGLLEYEALKRELSLLTTAIAAFGSIYCGLLFSIEASVSYALGALGSLLYLQLLFRHADRLSEENVASVFRRKRQKKIGVRSSDLQDAFEKALFGSSFALSSPRLVIPVALYGLWTYQLGHLQLDLQITPLMFGFFAYKAAVLVQTFRENKNLAMSFEKDKSTSVGR
ncbi:hypothetical protein L7F22_051943 [Adiantum nelumboides]|nr:hypothetical protein [Adiantum nelumboides]